MELKLNGRKFEFFDDVNITMRYDSIASAFGFKALFDPNDQSHKELFKPLSYGKVEIYHADELLITGRKISSSFQSSASPSLATFSGYSLTGFLEDCSIPLSAYPLQFNSLTLRQITEKLLKPFGLSVVVDDIVKSDVDSVFKTTDADASSSVRDYIVKLAIQKSIIVSHTRGGSLLFTRAKTGGSAVADLSDCLEKTLSVDGQGIHSTIAVVKEADITGGNAGESELKNSLVPSFRPSVSVQSSGDDNDSEMCAKAKRASELKAIKLTLKLDSWMVGDKVAKPNSIITIKDPDIYLYNKTRFLIESVTLTGNSKEQTTTLECVLPETHTLTNPVNPF